MVGYDWKLSETEFTKDKGKVFSCFACGGGSSFGYKLAGFDVIGCNEIDPRMMAIYKENHHPKYTFLEGIQTFKDRDDLPEELYQLDILDGSPPCSSFSSAGERENGWGKKKKFREGQAEQVLDTLFFDFIDLAKRLQPKVIVAENVKGILLGNARRYAERVVESFDAAGYYVKWFLLDASKMGVPQARERVFFCCLRKDLAGPVLENDNLFDPTPRLVMEFNEPRISVGEFADFKGDECTSKVVRELWENRKYGDGSQMDACIRLYGRHSNFGQSYVYLDKPSPTLTAHKDVLIHFEKPRYTSVHEVCCISTFPQDYNFLEQQPWYVCGMSVPPLMMYGVASEIYKQWLSKI